MDPLSIPAIAPDMKVTLSTMARAAQGQALSAMRTAITADAVSPSGASFGVAMRDALGKVSELQSASRTQAQQFQLGNPDVSLEETMIAGQKAQVAFQATMQVRNRLIQAYQEVMQMNV